MLRMSMLAALVLAAASPFTGASAGDDEITISFVHGEQRLDVPRGSVRKIRPLGPMVLMNGETGERKVYPRTGVELCVSGAVRARICDFTGQALDQVINVVIGCEVVQRPRILSPLCSSDCIRLSTFDDAETQKLMEKLRNSSRLACASPKKSPAISLAGLFPVLTPPEWPGQARP